MSIRVVFMGSPDFAVPSLKALAEVYPVVGVVTQPDREAGRGRTLVSPPVKLAALELSLPVIQPEKLRAPEAMAQLQAWNPDLIVVAAFGQILHPAVLDLPRYGCVNLHGSLLPRWRGAAPIQAAILAGDRETGVTIMKMDSGVDTGPMLSQRAMPIKLDDTAGSLFERMSTLGAEVLMETLPGYLDGLIQPRPQPEEGVTYASMLKKEDGLLDFTLSAENLTRRVRAFNPWPGAFFEWQGGLMKVHQAHAVEGLAEPGAHLKFQKMPAIGTGDGILVLDIVQPAGKKAMEGKAFLAGTRWGKP
jgi:methionyl-tRNA formyltransferase